MSTDKPNPTSARSGRSPAYPAFALPQAIERVKRIHDTQRTNSVSVDAALESIGYTSLNGTAQRALAALISYGLLVDQGSGADRKVRVTEQARKILLLPEDDPDRQVVVEECALLPRIYREMVAEWPEHLPSDTEIVKFLTFKKGYHESTAPALIRDFKETYNFANLGNRGNITPVLPDSSLGTGGEGNGSNDDSNNLLAHFNKLFGGDTGSIARAAMNTAQHQAGHSFTPPPPAPVEMRPYTLPMLNGRVAVLQMPSDCTPDDFGIMERAFKVIKDSLPGAQQAASTAITPIAPPAVRKGNALWNANGVDVPVVVTGYLGVRDDRHYVGIEGSASGFPLDQITYPDEEGAEGAALDGE